MKNIELRILISDAGVTYRDIAKELDITPEWLSRLMRYPLTEENESRIRSAVRKLEGVEVGDV